MPNLEAHIQNMRSFGVPTVVVVNSFPTDTAAEHALIRERALAAGADFAVSHTVHANGGMGGVELAEAVVEACEMPKRVSLLYPDSYSIKGKIEAVATGIYGADGVTYSSEADEAIATFTRLGYAHMPVCIAKTQFSLSHDASLKGRPRGWKLPVRDVRASVGAGFLYPLCADIRTMPGLPTKPAGDGVDIDESGNVVGLF
jgi:formyltetrahydrofolate synthetase